MSAAWLEQRGVVEVAGADAGSLLQRLFTNDVAGLAAGEGRYAALLTPQGKIVCDFLVALDAAGTFWLDCPRSLAPELTKKLSLYRLRARATITDRSDLMGVAAAWPEEPESGGLVFRDPRHVSLGYRIIAPQADLGRLADPQGEAAYRTHRIVAGVPEGGVDFAYGETFPHEANLDRLHGLDFTKGCYVGQEVVSRVEHRGTARKRVMPVMFEGEAPPVGSEVVVGHIAIGTMGSAIPGTAEGPGRGLAMVRIDRAADAAAEGAVATANGTHLSIALGAVAPGAIGH